MPSTSKRITLTITEAAERDLIKIAAEVCIKKTVLAESMLMQAINTEKKKREFNDGF